MPDDQPEEKKIYVDEDWKSQAAAEKEALERMKREKAGGEGRTGAGDQQAAQDQAQAAGARGPMPPPSLPLLVTTLATQAMMALGAIPNPLTKKAEVDLAQARHFIDMIQLLQEKTEGNRTAEESRMMDDMLHEVRMAFVETQKSGPEAS